MNNPCSHFKRKFSKIQFLSIRTVVLQKHNLLLTVSIRNGREDTRGDQ